MNNVSLIGNLTRDPELSYTQNQTAKCVFTIAVNRPRRQGEDQGADYIRIVTWGQRAETCGRYLKQGKKVGVKGSIRTGSYKDRDGRTVYTTDVWADETEFLTPAAGNKAQQPQSRQPDSQPQQASFDDLPDEFTEVEDTLPF